MKLMDVWAIFDSKGEKKSHMKQETGQLFQTLQGLENSTVRQNY